MALDKTQIYDALNRAYFSDDAHEKEVLERLPTLLEDGSLLVDVGASLGQYTHTMCDAVSNSEIWAIEADPIRADELARNCDIWDQATTNKVTVENLALTDHSGEVPYFVTNSDVSGGLTMHTTPRAVDWEEITVRSASLDDLFPDRTPDFVKIDVEGAELTVLSGARRILAARRTIFLIELHDWAEVSGGPERVRALMGDTGYTELSFHGQPLFVGSRRLWLKLSLLVSGQRILRRAQRVTKR